jgi:Subtilase family
VTRDLEHFALPTSHGAVPRQRHGGGGVVTRNRAEHGARLVGQTNALSTALQQRIDGYPAGVDPQLLFRIRLAPTASLSEDQLRALQLRLVAVDPGGVLVVFPDRRTLDELRSRLQQYAGIVEGHAYSYLTGVEAIEELAREDRFGRRLAAIWPPELTIPLDVELWHPGTREGARELVARIHRLAETHPLRITDEYVGSTVCVLRVHAGTQGIELMLGLDFVREVETISPPAFDVREVVSIGRVEVAPLIDVALDGLVGVVVIDSGVAEGHPLLAPVLLDAQSFLGGSSSDVDAETPGHGTGVAGIAVYGDVGAAIRTREFRPEASLFSARVLDDRCHYDEDRLAESQLREVVEYFVGHYEAARVFNLSLGNSNRPYRPRSYQSRLAAVVDELAVEFRDRRILFVISSGNLPVGPTHPFDEIRDQYPRYLLDSPEGGVLDPATSAISLTVGGISYGLGRGDHGDYRLGLAVGGEEGWPSPFTRVGLGVDGAIKPDVVDYAGASRIGVGGLWAQPGNAGVPTTNRDFAPPEGQLFRTVAGTSYAAPRVSNLAAHLCREFPNASANLIRALIVQSAEVPLDRPNAINELPEWDADVLRLYGHGQPSYDRARYSERSEVLLLADEVIALDHFCLYEVPPLPANYVEARGRGRLTVTLAFDPPTRPTRGDSYLGVVMQYQLFKNVTADQVREAIRNWTRDDLDQLDDDDRRPTLGDIARHRLAMKPGSQLRKKGTAQKSSCFVSHRGWQYDGGPMTLAVICERKWAPTEVTEQPYAVIVSIGHNNPDVDVHAAVAQRARVYQRVRVRV